MSTMGFKPATGNVPIRVLPEHTTASSFKRGDLVILASGKVKLATADSALWGVACKDATGTADTDIPIWILGPDQVWIAAADTTTSAGHVGNDYGLNIGTAGSMSVDIGDTTTTSVTVIDLHPADGAKANGRVLIKFDCDVLKTVHGI